MLGNLRYQTRPPDEVLVYVSDTHFHEVLRLREEFPEAVFSVQPNRNDWGHEKRAIGLGEASCDYVGFFNDDDSYTLDYVERMMDEAEKGAEIVYCAWNVIPHCGFHLGNSTSGNYVVRTEIGQRVGYTGREYTADGEFINKLAHETNWIVKIDDVLYFHN